jgi:hypothetical protein
MKTDPQCEQSADSCALPITQAVHFLSPESLVIT